MMALLLDHVWQSSLCVGAAALLALALRKNGAHVRFWVWFAASLKFLVPFAALTALSADLLAPALPPVNFVTPSALRSFAFGATAHAYAPASAATGISPASTLGVRGGEERRGDSRVSRSGGAAKATNAASLGERPEGRPAPARTRHLNLESALLALWACGFALFVVSWLIAWFRIRAMLRHAVAIKVDAPIAVKASPSRLEPGLAGILHPVILLPQDARQLLSPAEFKAVLAHELCHWRRRDNLLAAIHMLVEALFWFFPLVWWLGGRLKAERERACDESVLADGNDPEIYAEAILRICRAYLKSPLACVAGVSGGRLTRRIETIMAHGRLRELSAARKFALSAAVAAVLALPLALGLMAAPIMRSEAKGAPRPLAKITRTAAIEALPPASATTRPARSENSPRRDETAAAQPSPRFSRLIARLKFEATKLQVTKLEAPSLDLSRLLPAGISLTPQMVASNEPPAHPASPGAPSTCAPRAIVDSVNLVDIPGTALKTVPVIINGTQKQFLLDIGSNRTEVARAAVSELSLPEAEKSPGPGQGLGMDIDYARVALFDVNGAQSAGDFRSHVRVASFTIGAATGHNLAFVVAKDPEMGRSKPYDGLMTGDFFSQYDVELDFAQNKLNYLTPAPCADSGRLVYWPHASVAAMPMTKLDGKIQVEVSIGGRAIPAVIDTSSPRTVMRRDIAELMFGLKADTPEMMPDGDARDGAGLKVYQHSFPEIAFTGGVTAYNVPVLIQTGSMIHNPDRTPVLGSRAQFYADPSQRIPALTLGMDVLGQLHLYIPHDGGMLYATSAARGLEQASATGASPGSSM